MAVVYIRARQNDWPVDSRPSLARLGHAALHAAVPMVVPFVILAGFILGIITATEAGAVVAGYAFLAAKLYYRNVSWREMGRIAYDSAILTAAVVFLLAIASVYQYLMGVSGVPQLLGQVLGPLKAHPWLFLIGTAAMSCLFGMVLEGLPAAVVLIPVVFPISEAMGIDPIHFNIVQTPGSPAIQEVFGREEVAIPVKCNVHPWMKSYIAVFKHPYFQVTGVKGTFELKNLPPGTYTIEAWQEKFGTVSQSVTVGPKESKAVNLIFKPAAAGD